MNFFKKLKNLFKREKECEQDEYCPIYLSYLNKYGESSNQIKYCKNSNKQYCIKYRLIDKDEWKNLSKIERIEIVKKAKIIDFLD